MSDFHAVCSLDDIPVGGRRSVDVAGEEVTLLRLGDEHVVALANRCPHQNGRLGDGPVVGGQITCPMHQWRFDLRTGVTRRDRRVVARLYRVRVEGASVAVAPPVA